MYCAPKLQKLYDFSKICPQQMKFIFFFSYSPLKELRRCNLWKFEKFLVKLPNEGSFVGFQNVNNVDKNNNSSSSSDKKTCNFILIFPLTWRAKTDDVRERKKVPARKKQNKESNIFIYTQVKKKKQSEGYICKKKRLPSFARLWIVRLPPVHVYVCHSKHASHPLARHTNIISINLLQKKTTTKLHNCNKHE